jgi:hypothetical protein
MRLTWRDAVDTVLAGAVAVIGLAVANDWGWPALGGPRVGTLALGIVGIAMCAISGGGEAVGDGLRDPTVKVLTALGIVAFVLIVAGLITGSEPVFVALAIDIVGMCLMTTIRHATVMSGARRPGSIAGRGEAPPPRIDPYGSPA